MTNTVLQVVYAGQRRRAKGGTLHWYALPDGSDFGGFDKPLVSGARVGTLIELQETPEGKYVTRGDNGPRALGAAPDLDDATLASWKITTDLIRTEDAKASTERRLAREAGQPFEDALETLRMAVAKLPWQQRAAAVQMIVNRLR